MFEAHKEKNAAEVAQTAELAVQVNCSTSSKSGMQVRISEIPQN